MKRRIVVGLLLGLLAAAGYLALSLRGRRPNVVIILSDTLRRDHLGCFGYSRDTSPGLDRFAQQALLYERAYAQSPSTKPSVASLFTSRFVSEHRVVRNEDVLSSDFTTLAEVLAAAGYRTAGFLENGVVGRAEANFGQGFEVWKFYKDARHSDPVKRASAFERMDRSVDRWIEDNRSAPFLLYVHYIDPHSPYEPIGDYRGRFARAGAASPLDDPIYAGQKVIGPQGLVSLDAGAMADLIDRYDEEIRFVDDRLQGVLDRLASLRLLDDSLVVFLSDHGEGFGEHGYIHHSSSVYAELIDVPLVIRYPRTLSFRMRHRSTARAGRVTQPAQQIDVFPTVLDALGIAGGEVALRGRSLLAEPARAPAIVSEHLREGWGDDMQRALLRGRWKLVRSLNAGSFELFDLTANGADARDVLAEADPRLVDSLARTLAGWEARIEAGEEPQQMELDEESREMLRALGYVR